VQVEAQVTVLEVDTLGPSPVEVGVEPPSLCSARCGRRCSKGWRCGRSSPPPATVLLATWVEPQGLTSCRSSIRAWSQGLEGGGAHSCTRVEGHHLEAARWWRVHPTVGAHVGEGLKTGSSDRLPVLTLDRLLARRFARSNTACRGLRRIVNELGFGEMSRCGFLFNRDPTVDVVQGLVATQVLPR
jgi:hypothetical protein